MNRCSQVVADALTKRMAELSQFASLNQLDKLSFNSSLKYLMVNDPKLTVEITSKNSFEIYESEFGLVVDNGPALSQARLADFFLGANRVKNQYSTIAKLRASNAPVAWIIVSAYYCAFFAAIEMCKLLSRISLSIDGGDIEGLKIKAIGADHSAFFDNSPGSFVGIENAGKLQFSSSGTKPHEAAWINVRIVINKLLGEFSWMDAKSLMLLFEDTFNNPSKIRNHWNYKRSDYYGPAGERAGHQFIQIIGNQSGAMAWLERSRGRCNALEPCVIAVFCELFSSAVIDAAERGRYILRDSVGQLGGLRGLNSRSFR